MKRLVTQFDNGLSGVAIATPTCSSCCCCCCCLATSIASSSLLARRVRVETLRKKIVGSASLTALAALFIPVTGVLVYAVYKLINLSQKCMVSTINYGTPTSYGGVQSYSYPVCTRPAYSAIPILSFVMPVLVLTYIYTRAKMQKPLLRGFVVTIFIGILMAAEAWGGALLILTGVGGIAYLISIPFLIGIINVY